ncbi:MAG: alpha/beta fold hydrolase [Deltaproteobacteria bacterium]|nr:alpha/beta fold hydrolase [Deltaproteobacteria bacterium]
MMLLVPKPFKGMFFGVGISCALASLTGCPDIKQDPVPGSTGADPAALTTMFDTDAGLLPLPTDALRKDGGTSGSMRIDFGYPPSYCATVLTADAGAYDSKTRLYCGLQTLDGFGTFQTISFPVRDTTSAYINTTNLTNPATLIAGLLIETTTFSAIPLIFDSETYKSYRNETGGGQIYLKPARPLKQQTTYIAVLTDTLLDNVGRPVAPDAVTGFLMGTAKLYDSTTGKIIHPLLLKEPSGWTFAAWTAQVAYLEAIRQQLSPGIDLVVAVAGAVRAGFTRSNLVSFTVFTTQTITGVMATADPSIPAVGNVPAGVLTTEYVAGLIAAHYTPSVTKSASTPSGWFGAYADAGLGVYGGPPYSTGIKEIITGTIKIRSFLKDKGLGSFDSAKLPSTTAPFGAPEEQLVPYVLFTPATSPGGDDGGTAGPYKYIIASHGFAGWRWTTYLFAGALCSAGFAVIAIDLPLFGDRTLDLSGNNVCQTYFGGACTPNPAATAPAAISSTVYSGSLFISPTDIFATRDHMRQAALDLFQVGQAIINVDGGFNNVTTVDTRVQSGSAVGFLGHSMGGMVGAQYAYLGRSADGGMGPLVNPVVLSGAGGGLVDILKKNALLKAAADIALADAGYVAGTQTYDMFFQTAQWVMDPGDPINWAWALRNDVSTRKFLLHQPRDGGGGTDEFIHNDTQDRLYNAFNSDGGVKRVKCSGSHFQLYNGSAQTAAVQSIIATFFANPAVFPAVTTTLCDQM